MDSKILCSVLVITLICIHSTLSQATECYYCHPDHESNKCFDPVESSSQNTIINCNEQYGPPSDNATYICISASIKYGNASQTGIFRDCMEAKPKVNYCIHFEKGLMVMRFLSFGYLNITLVSCNTCTNSLCNRQIFDLNGIANNAASLQYVLFPLVLCLIFLRAA
ncbi:uncharacterized protein LOC115884683 [Sitophilus oryzae]|uniref:Uncharacterized protein LOC115884683 n=1 Tax=Sitophilus oryzae TaxID=7048 RepID=A0A6J2Y6E5_SITOR|nr:uncharacterized protein LOC115884683 [Sitophilus oryzae]